MPKGWSDLSRCNARTRARGESTVFIPQVPPTQTPVLGDYSLYRGWIISLQWSAPNRLSHWFSQSPGISSGKLASSEDSHGSCQARSADYGESFTKFHFLEFRATKAPFHYRDLPYMDLRDVIIFIIRPRMCASVLAFSLYLPNISYGSIFVVRWQWLTPGLIDRFRDEIDVTWENFYTELESFRKVACADYL